MQINRKSLWTAAALLLVYALFCGVTCCEAGEAEKTAVLTARYNLPPGTNLHGAVVAVTLLPAAEVQKDAYVVTSPAKVRAASAYVTIQRVPKGVHLRMAYLIRADKENLLKYQGLAKKGEATAQHILACMYYGGGGITPEPADAAEAVKWWRKAAEQGIAGAQYSLGNMYHAGYGVQKDLAQARKWWGKAAAQRYPNAAESLRLLEGSGE